MKTIDVLILGGGPAGSLTAALIKKQNPSKSVMILEKAHFPRHHVGEVTLPGWSKILRRAGLLDKLDAAMPIKKAGVLFNWGPDPDQGRWTADFRETKSGRPADGSWHVDRAEFDQIALNHARSLGAVAVEGATALGAERIGVDFEVRYRVDGVETVQRAHHLVDASGQARLLSRWWNLDVTKHDELNNFAVYGYWTGSIIAETDWRLRAAERWATISACEKGWIWHIPIKPDLVSVGWVSTKDTVQREPELLEAYLEQARLAESIGPLLAEATYIGNRPVDGDGPTSISVAQDWSYQVKNCAGEGWLLIGDAAMFVDPILSSGLTLAANGANMAANFLNTLWTTEGVDEASLVESMQRAMQDQARSYLHMAKVWYRQNLSVDSWHWEARQQRLTAGGLSIYERDQDAFTALCLGAIGSPLDAVASQGSKDIWGSEFFAWITAGRLFSPGESREGDKDSADTARKKTHRQLMGRWRTMLSSTPRLTSGSWEQYSGYHTNPHLSHWERVQCVRFYPDPEDMDNAVIFPCFEDFPESLLPLLDGQKTVASVMRHALAGHATDSEAFLQRQKAFAELLLQLDLMGCLETQRVAPPQPPQSDSPLFKGPLTAVLSSTSGPIEISATLDWTGDYIDMEVKTETEYSKFHLRVDDLARMRWVGRRPTWGYFFYRRIQRWANGARKDEFDDIARHAGLELWLKRDDENHISVVLPV